MTGTADHLLPAEPAPAPASRRRSSVFSREIVVQAIWDSFPKLDPRRQVHNPVMFIVELGSAITTVILVLVCTTGSAGAGGSATDI